MLPIPPSAGLPRTWLIITTPCRIAKIEPLASSWIARPELFLSSPAISPGGSPDVGMVCRALVRDELDERDRGHRQVERKHDAPALSGHGARPLEQLEPISFTKAGPALLVRPVRPAKAF